MLQVPARFSWKHYFMKSWQDMRIMIISPNCDVMRHMSLDVFREGTGELQLEIYKI